MTVRPQALLSPWLSFGIQLFGNPTVLDQTIGQPVTDPHQCRNGRNLLPLFDHAYVLAFHTEDVAELLLGKTHLPKENSIMELKRYSDMISIDTGSDIENKRSHISAIDLRGDKDRLCIGLEMPNEYTKYLWVKDPAIDFDKLVKDVEEGKIGASEIASVAENAFARAAKDISKIEGFRATRTATEYKGLVGFSRHETIDYHPEKAEYSYMKTNKDGKILKYTPIHYPSFTDAGKYILSSDPTRLDSLFRTTRKNLEPTRER